MTSATLGNQNFTTRFLDKPNDYVLINDDCLHALKLIEDNSIDCVVTDPPYGFTYQTWRPKRRRTGDKPILNDNENYYDLLDNTLKECYRVMKDGSAIYIFTGYQMIDGFVELTKKYFNYKNLLVWVKNNWTAGDLKGNYGTKTEFVIYATKGRHILNGRRDHTVLSYKRIPPTRQHFKFQKPLRMLEFLIKKSSAENDVILDPFVGSGSTIVASRNLNRKSIGIEADPNVYKIAETRLEERI